jgi:GNAT superfamily N-acetyltransferase
MTTALIRVSPLDRSFHLEAFDCGIAELNKFIKNYALKNQKQRISRTSVAHEENSITILGFHTLSAASISATALPQDLRNKLPRYPVPCVLLARLAVDRNSQRIGIGKLLLKDAIEKIMHISALIGAYALLVDAKEDRARSFYEYYGFLRLPDRPYTLFLPIDTFADIPNSRYGCFN